MTHRCANCHGHIAEHCPTCNSPKVVKIGETIPLDPTWPMNNLVFRCLECRSAFAEGSGGIAERGLCTACQVKAAFAEASAKPPGPSKHPKRIQQRYGHSLLREELDQPGPITDGRESER